MAEIANEADLREWLDAHPRRHRQISDDECSCGWKRLPEWGSSPTWNEHQSSCLIADLGDVLPSDAWQDGDNVSWRKESKGLYEALDAAHIEIAWWERTASSRLTSAELEALNRSRED